VRREKFLISLFKKYYKVAPLRPPTELTSREFGFTFFSGGGMLRHVSFPSFEELKSFLRNKVPSNVYYSTAYYRDPSLESMEEKGWLGADLVFDIDADHLPVKGDKGSYSWQCGSCRKGGVGEAPGQCPYCGSKEIKEVKWMSTLHLRAAIEECEKLVDVLLEDFGFADKEVKIYFSGHRGFHIHIECEEVKKLSQEARREIVDYLECVGIEVSPLGPYKKFMDLNSPGWMGRITRGIYDVIASATEELLSSIRVPKRGRERILSMREEILRSLEAHPTDWDSILRVSKAGLEKITGYVIEAIKCRIDERVTIDTHRLIRFPYSLHGKTGLIVKELKTSELGDFDPLEDATPFRDGRLKVKLEIPIPKEVMGRDVERKGCVADVEYPLAIYLIANGGAEPLE